MSTVTFRSRMLLKPLTSMVEVVTPGWTAFLPSLSDLGLSLLTVRRVGEVTEVFAGYGFAIGKRHGVCAVATWGRLDVAVWYDLGNLVRASVQAEDTIVAVGVGGGGDNTFKHIKCTGVRASYVIPSHS